MNPNYKIEAMKILLDESCILKRYFELIPYKYILLENLKKLGCNRKSDCEMLSNEVLLTVGLKNAERVALFRAFLSLYDINTTKLKEIDSVCETPEEAASFWELYHLPGVKSTRAMLYYKAGFCSLEKIAESSPQEIITKTEQVITEENLDLKVPLMKEIRTHIAVARAFTDILDM